jgi:hypothetical protein
MADIRGKCVPVCVPVRRRETRFESSGRRVESVAKKPGSLGLPMWWWLGSRDSVLEGAAVPAGIRAGEVRTWWMVGETVPSWLKANSLKSDVRGPK